ncbi:hypothetical protein ACIP2X_38050 [Streptomyces sp. NPDC089424]|uniref:hypothetical protein n=1 Tax=Streptomyces sp. NPDC089424 TaxID=3365917 RepID=UPI003807E4A2
MTDQTAVPCNAAQLHRLGDRLSTHGPHEWIVQPGMPPVRCPGAGDQQAAVPAGQAPATDRADLRQRIADVLAAADGWQWVTDRDKARSSTYRSYQTRADAVLSVLPAHPDQATVLREAADGFDRHAEQLLYGVEGKAVFVAKALEEQAAVWRVAAETLRRMGDEAQPAEKQPETCAHCGKSILRITGTLAAWWVHDPGGHTICDPQRAASSPRATPKPAVEAQQPKEA